MQGWHDAIMEPQHDLQINSITMFAGHYLIYACKWIYLFICNQDCNNLVIKF